MGHHDNIGHDMVIYLTVDINTMIINSHIAQSRPIMSLLSLNVRKCTYHKDVEVLFPVFFSPLRNPYAAIYLTIINL